MRSKISTLILGGARSGKSRYAQDLAASRGERVLYVATAEAGDDEMRERIAKHRQERPAQWTTLEASREIGSAVKSAGDEFDVVLLDCLTLLASNIVLALPEPVQHAEAEAAVLIEAQGILEALRASRAGWIIVSNEVGLGLVPPYPLGRVYRDALGRANQVLAGGVDEVLFMVAGLPMRVK